QAPFLRGLAMRHMGAHDQRHDESGRPSVTSRLHGHCGLPSPADAPETTRPSASVIRLASTRREPSLDRYPSTMMVSPIFKSPRLKPRRDSAAGAPPSQPHRTISPLSSLTSR